MVKKGHDAAVTTCRNVDVFHRDLNKAFRPQRHPCFLQYLRGAYKTVLSEAAYTEYQAPELSYSRGALHHRKRNACDTTCLNRRHLECCEKPCPVSSSQSFSTLSPYQGHTIRHYCRDIDTMASSRNGNHIIMTVWLVTASITLTESFLMANCPVISKTGSPYLRCIMLSTMCLIRWATAGCEGAEAMIAFHMRL